MCESMYNQLTYITKNHFFQKFGLVETLYGGQLTSSTQLMKPNYSPPPPPPKYTYSDMFSGLFWGVCFKLIHS